MVTLSELSASSMAKILRIRRKIEILEQQMAKVVRDDERKTPPTSVAIRHMRLPRHAQPSLREMIADILQTANKPLGVSEIYEASLNKGYQWRSHDPLNALNVKMYTDSAFKKVAPGRFILRKTAK